MERPVRDFNDVKSWYKEICSRLPGKEKLYEFRFEDYDENDYYPNYGDLTNMSEQKLLYILKTETDVVVNNNITKQRMIDILDMHYSIIHMQRYLNTLNEYFKDVSECAQSRESHYRECMMTNKWKKGQKEDERHRYWRSTFDELCKDYDVMHIKWSCELAIIKREFKRLRSNNYFILFKSSLVFFRRVCS